MNDRFRTTHSAEAKLVGFVLKCRFHLERELVPTDREIIEQALINALAARKQQIDETGVEQGSAASLLSQPQPSSAIYDIIKDGVASCEAYKRIEDRWLFCGGNGIKFTGQDLAKRIFSMASWNPGAALDWTLKILHTLDAEALLVAVAWGFAVDKPIAISDTLRIVPIKDVPASFTKERLLKRARQLPEDFVWLTTESYAEPAAAFVLTIPKFPYTSGDTDFESWTASDNALESIFEVNSVIQALCTHMPVVLGSWMQYADTELEVLLDRFNLSWSPPEVGPRIATHIEIDEVDFLEILKKYMSLDEGTRYRIERAMKRYTLSQCRRHVDDKALDLALAFETAVTAPGGADKSTPPVYKVSVRTAQLIGGSLGERKETRRKVSKLYEQRSVTVHGGTTADVAKAEKIIAEADELFPKLVRRIVQAGGIGDWSEVELQHLN